MVTKTELKNKIQQLLRDAENYQNLDERCYASVDWDKLEDKIMALIDLLDSDESTD